MSSYPFRTPGDLGFLVDRLDSIEKQLRQVTSPTGEQYAQSVAGVRKAVDDVAETQRRIPISDSLFNSSSVPALQPGVWSSFMQYGLAAPKDRNNLFGQVAATASILSAPNDSNDVIMRIVIKYADGSQDVSPSFYPSKSAVGTSTRHTLNGLYRIDARGDAQSSSVGVAVQFMMTGTNALPANNASYAASSMQVTGTWA